MCPSNTATTHTRPKLVHTTKKLKKLRRLHLYNLTTECLFHLLSKTTPNVHMSNMASLVTSPPAAPYTPNSNPHRTDHQFCSDASVALFPPSHPHMRRDGERGGGGGGGGGSPNAVACCSCWKCGELADQAGCVRVFLKGTNSCHQLKASSPKCPLQQPARRRSAVVSPPAPSSAPPSHFPSAPS